MNDPTVDFDAEAKLHLEPIMTFKHLSIAFLAISACGEIPDATMQYHLTKTDLRVDVTRTVKCSIVAEKTGDTQVAPTAADNFVILTTTVSPLPTNSADTESVTGTIDLMRIKGTFTDPEIKVDYYPDGRLKAINSTQTGTAKQILDSTLTLAATVAGKGSGVAASDRIGDTQDACAYIFKHSKEEKGQLSLSYSAPVVARPGTHRKLEPSETSSEIHAQLSRFNQIRDIYVRIGSNDIKPLSKPIISGAKDTAQTLTARQLSKVRLSIYEQGGPELWHGTVLMALPGNEFEVPLPKRPAFGTAKFELALDDAGAIQKLSYVATSGGSDAVDLAASVVGNAQESTASEQAAALSAEAELIKQRQRLANCQSDPVNCE